MNIDIFMVQYKSKKTAEDKAAFVRKHIKSNYIPFETKADTAHAIVASCYWRTAKDINGDDYEEFYIDSIAKYMLTCMSMVELYTDIDRRIADSTMLEDFNTLNESGVIDLIINSIDDRELKEFNMVIQMACDDAIANEYENHAFIRQQVERFGYLIGNTLAPVLGRLDINKIEEILKNVKN